MNSATFFKFLAISLVLTVGGIGCKKTPKALTYIPTATRTAPGGDTGPSRPIDPGVGVPTDPGPTKIGIDPDGTALSIREREGNYFVDREMFSQQTIYFDFDSSAVRASEKSKADAVAAYLKNQPTHKVRVEGHCDERGTSEYNRALGERRALSVREYLIAVGIAPERLSVVSFGEDKPAVLGSDDAAWEKNRRGEFVVLKPKT